MGYLIFFVLAWCTLAALVVKLAWPIAFLIVMALAVKIGGG